MTTQNFSQTAAFIWSVADLLRGDFKQSQYGRIILPFTLLRRLECVLADHKEAVVEKYATIKDQGMQEDMIEKQLTRISKHAFYNISPMDLSKLGQSDIKDNLNTYIQSFSKDAREIFGVMDIFHAGVWSNAIYCLYLQGINAMNQKTALFVVINTPRRMDASLANSSINVSLADGSF